MKVAAPYPKDNLERQAKIGEYNVEFDCNRHVKQDLIAWCLEHLNKRINIKFIDKPDAREFSLNVIAELGDLPNVAVRLDQTQGNFVSFIQECGIKFFFDYDYKMNSFCRLYDALELGVSDVYILEDLCYRLPQVRELCSLYGAQIRLVANSISSFTSGRGTDITAPWFVPENYDVLQQYYDVIEFELFNSWQRFDALYKIWIEDKCWDNNLKFINFELKIDIPGDSFMPEVCEYKMTCGHRCVERQAHCRKCEQMLSFAQDMAKKKLRYTLDKKWVKNDEDEPIEDIFK